MGVQSQIRYPGGFTALYRPEEVLRKAENIWPPGLAAFEPVDQTYMKEIIEICSVFLLGLFELIVMVS